jgi:molybdopterin/thiamine biosynthesis adenylyltransferase
VLFSRNASVRDQLAGRLVSIVGCGSFGSALADMLVRAGVDRLVLTDPEVLSIENVGRHVLTARDVGRMKVDALAERLRDINPELNVEARQQRFQDGDGLLVCCADSRRCESMVNAIALAKGLPAVYVAAYGAVRAGEVQFYVPGKTACRECFARFRQPDETRPSQERYTDPDFDPTRTPGATGLWGSVLAVSGIAFHVILALLNVRGKLDYDRPLWIVNLDYEGFRPYAVTFARVARGCAVCDESKVAELTVE